MAPATKKQRHRKTPREAVEDFEELRTDRNRLRDQVTGLQARVAELEAALNAVNEAGRRSKGADEKVDEDVHVVEVSLQGDNKMQLPLEVWARILEFSLYSDVARMARVSTSFLHEVMPLLRSLYFDDAEAFTPKQAKRFESGNVEEIVIGCVFKEVSKPDTFGDDSSGDDSSGGDSSGVYKDDPDRDVEFIISLVRGRLALMLSCLSNVKSVFIGLGFRETKAEILQRLVLDGSAATGYCHKIFPQDSKERNIYFDSKQETVEYRNLLCSLSDAYRQEFISQDLIIYGLPSWHFIDGCDYHCTVCGDICRTFPLIQVTTLKDSGPSYIPCLSGIECGERLNLIAERKGGKDVLKSKESELFHDLLEQCAFVKLLYDHSQWVITYGAVVLNAMRLLKDYGCDPRAVHSDALSQAFLKFPKPYSFHKPPKRGRIKESTFQTLSEIGFSMSECDLSIIPDGQCSGDTHDFFWKKTVF